MIKKLEVNQAVAISAFTGVLCCEFSDFHRAIEERLGRPIFTHELGDKAVSEEIKEGFRKDFISMVP
jgi:hypothetical protein